MLDHKDIPGGFLTVYDWFDGLCMGRMYSTAAQFQALPVEEKLAIYNDILSFHMFVHQQGYIAVDFYDGCLLYDPEHKALRICDIEFYRLGPFTNEMGRMWGSGRFMSPEEFTLCAVIDERSNVFAMGATAFQLFGGGAERDIAAWPLSRARYDIARKATENAPALRYPSIAALQEAWNTTE